MISYHLIEQIELFVKSFPLSPICTTDGYLKITVKLQVSIFVIKLLFTYHKNNQCKINSCNIDFLRHSSLLLSKKKLCIKSLPLSTFHLSEVLHRIDYAKKCSFGVNI